MAEPSLSDRNSQDEMDTHDESTQGESAVNLSARTSASSSASKSSKRKKSKYDLLDEKWNNKFNSLDNKIDNKFDKFESLLQGHLESRSRKRAENGDESESDTNTSHRRGKQRKQQSHRHVELNSEVSENEDGNISDDNISLQPGQAEKILSDSEVELGDEKVSEKAKKCLFELFGEDALTKKPEKKVGIQIDNAQKEVLMGHWRAEAPNLITAFAEDTKEAFPVEDETEKFLQVPSLDDLIGRCLAKRHGSKAGFSKSGKYLYSQPYRMLEKVAYRGQQSAYVGIVIAMYMQQSLGNLIEILTSDKNVSEQAVEQVRGIFAMSTKCLDQLGRTGAFHHILRRQMCMTDTSLYQLDDSRDVADLPLTGDGVFGAKLETSLKSRKEKNKALEELLPELSKTNRKRKSTTEDKGAPIAKKANVSTHKSVSSTKDKDDGFRIPKKNNFNNYKKSFEDKQSKSDNGPRKGSFPPRGGKTNRQ